MLRGVLVPVSLLVAVTLLWTGCGADQDSGAADSANTSLAAVIKGLDNPFFETMRDGLVATAGRYDVQLRVESAAGQEDAAGQASRLDSQATLVPGCYIVNPISQVNLIQPLSRVKAGTPIVNIDSPVAQEQATAVGVRITTYIGTDNVAAGRAGADAMAALVPRGARVAVLTGPPGDATSDARIAGFRSGAKGRFSVATAAAADFDRRQAQLAAEDLLAADPRLRGLFAANDLMALGGSTAVRAARRGNGVAIIGVDGIREALTAVQRGAISGTVAQYPYAIGQLGVQACIAAERKEQVPARIDAPIEVVTKANVARAQASFPQPIEAFDNPLEALLAK